VSDRDVDQLLADLRGRLEAGVATRPPRRWHRRGTRRAAALLAVLMLAAGSTAVATRSVWAPSAPGDRGAGGPVVRLLAGGPATARWSLAAERCADGSVATFLRVGEGGAGRGCDGRPSAVSSYYDPAGRKTYIFAVVPAAARTAQLGLRGTPAGSATPGVVALDVVPRPADPLALERGGLPASAVVIAGHPGAWTPATVAVVDDHRRMLLRCQEARCTVG
jgi:hypothetical protein